MKVVAYYRVSTEAQGKSGLGLESQQEYIRIAQAQAGWEVVAAFTDHVSGTVSPMDRKGLRSALELCRKEGYTLVVAKLDRLSRDVADIAQLMKVVDFKVATMPAADKFQLHIYAALAEQERDFISVRTKDALSRLQARADEGIAQAQQSVANRTEQLEKGRTAANREKAQAAINQRVSTFHASIEPHIQACLYKGVSTLAAVADCLNAKRVTTSRGGEWSPIQVSRAMKALSLSF